MAPDAYDTTEVESRRECMQAVADGLSKCEFPALDANTWEVGGYAEHPDFRQIAMTIRAEPAYQAFNVASAGDSVFGENHGGQGSAPARIVKRDLSISETVVEFAERGHIESALEVTFDRTGDRNLSLDILQYNLFLFAKGWEAERALAKTERFSKASESQDLGGIDFYDDDVDGYVQLKSARRGYTGRGVYGPTGSHIDENDVPVVYYQYDENGKIHVSRNHTEANGKAADIAGAKKTDMQKYLMWA